MSVVGPAVWRVVTVTLLMLLCLPVSTVDAQEIIYTFSGVIRVLDLSSPPPGSGATIPGADPLGMDGAAILLTCVIDSTTAPSHTGANADGSFAFYNAGTAILAVTGSVGGGVDGTYVNIPCSVRVDDFPIGSPSGGDVLSITTTWDLGMPFPDVFQVPFAQLGDSTFSGIGLQSFSATEVIYFIGVNFSGSSDVFHFEHGTGIAMASFVTPSPGQRINALIDTVGELPGINPGQKRALTNKLENAHRLLGLGRERPAIRQLNLFISRVRVLIDREVLTPEDGQSLIDEVNAVIEQILTG
jgi:hypothetical protein